MRETYSEIRDLINVHKILAIKSDGTTGNNWSYLEG